MNGSDYILSFLTASNIAIAKDIVVAFAAIITSGMAIWGIKKWRTELIGKAKFDTARNLLLTTYKLREGINYVRAPFISAGEFPENWDWQNPTREEDSKANLHVYRNRWKNVSDVLPSFDTAALEAETLWGKSAKELTDGLRGCVKQLASSIDIYCNQVLRGQIGKNDELALKSREDISDTKPDFPKDGQLTREIEESIKKIEVFLAPFLKR